MKSFELSEHAVLLGARNANDMLKVISAKFLNVPVRFTCNVNTGHTNRIKVVMRWQHAIELIGADDVVYRIPFGARIEIGDADVRVEMPNTVSARRNHECVRWVFARSDDEDADSNFAGTGAPPTLPPRTTAWPTREEDWLRIAVKMHLEVEVGA